MSLSWTPFLNDFFSCLLLALLFSCHSLAHVSSLLLGNRRQSSFIDRSSGFLSFSPSSSNLALFAQTVGFSWSCVRSTASLRLRTLFHVLRDQSTRTTHSLQSSSALGRHSFPSNYNTACLLNCFVFLCSFSSTLW